MALKTVTEYFGVGRDEIDQGEEIITVKVGGDNFLEKAQNIHIIYNFSPIVSWAEGTDEQIAAMVAAADAGQIQLEHYWSVGEERKVALSAMTASGVGESHNAQTVTFVLMDKDNTNYEYVTPPTSGETRARFIVGMKNGLATRGYMNSSKISRGGWDGCARRTWCNNIFYNALPTNLKPIFKQTKVKAMNGGSHSGVTLVTSNDYFFLAAEKEVSGDVYVSNLMEVNTLTQWEYYIDTNHRLKRHGDTGSVYTWWDRSPARNYDTSFGCIRGTGNASGDNASTLNLIAPCGCI